MNALSHLTLVEAENALVEEFDQLADWQERYEHIIAMPAVLPSFDPNDKQPQFLVHGCMSELWAVADYQDGRLRFKFSSDALISLGLAALLWRLVEARSPKDILSYKIALFQRLGLDAALSVRRGNGFASLVKRIKTLALHHAQ